MLTVKQHRFSGKLLLYVLDYCNSSLAALVVYIFTAEHSQYCCSHDYHRTDVLLFNWPIKITLLLYGCVLEIWLGSRFLHVFWFRTACLFGSSLYYWLVCHFLRSQPAIKMIYFCVSVLAHQCYNKENVFYCTFVFTHSKLDEILC